MCRLETLKKNPQHFQGVDSTLCAYYQNVIAGTIFYIRPRSNNLDINMNIYYCFRSFSEETVTTQLNIDVKKAAKYENPAENIRNHKC